MFFTLAKHRDSRFQNHDIVGSWWLSYDDGWSVNPDKKSWRKGYNQNSINHGNFLQIVELDSQIKLLHDRYRSFPLWWDDSTKTLTNLLGRGQKIYADEAVVLDSATATVFKTNILPELSTNKLSFEDAVNKIGENLIAKVWHLATNFAGTDKKLFVSGGVDTLTLLALTRKTNVDMDVIDYEHFDYDWFTNNNIDNIRSAHWAYSQIHHWRTPCLLLSGACGDEFLFRGPATTALWAAWNDIDIIDLVSKKDYYHSRYFLRQENAVIFKDAYQRREQIKKQYSTEVDLHKQILNINANDHQHWHLGSTLTWTPFKDLDLTHLVLQMPTQDILDQVLDAKINKLLIEYLDPDALGLLSDFKNVNVRQNLHLL